MVKKIKEKKSKVVVIESTPVVTNESSANPTKTRLQELQELYETLLKEKITSISKLEAMISQLQK